MWKGFSIFSKNQGHGSVQSAQKDQHSTPRNEGSSDLKVLKKGPAMRVIFFYPGEEGTYVDNVEVTLYENGIVQLKSEQEETTTHLQNCEILWSFDLSAEDRSNKTRVVKLKNVKEGSPRPSENSDPKNHDLS